VARGLVLDLYSVASNEQIIPGHWHCRHYQIECSTTIGSVIYSSWSNSHFKCICC